MPSHNAHSKHNCRRPQALKRASRPARASRARLVRRGWTRGPALECRSAVARPPEPGCPCLPADAICAALGFDVTTLVCTGNNHFRKPSYLLWEYFTAHCNDGKAVDLAKVRATRWGWHSMTVPFAPCALVFCRNAPSHAMPPCSCPPSPHEEHVRRRCGRTRQGLGARQAQGLFLHGPHVCRQRRRPVCHARDGTPVCSEALRGWPKGE